MNNTAINFQSDIQISIQPILSIFYSCALAVFTAGTLANEMTNKLILSLFALVIVVVSMGIGSLSSKSPSTSKWLSLLLFEIILSMVTYWLGPTTFYLFACLAPVLAAVLISPWASRLMTAIQTVLLILFYVLNGESDPALLTDSLIICWAVYALFQAAYKPVADIVEWAEDVYLSANETLEQLRDKRGEYEQTVAELKHANSQLTSLNKLAQNLRQIAETEKSAKAWFVANISHELRTPLNMIVGYSEMITQSPHMYGSTLPGALLADLSVVQRNAEQLARLVQ